jgi:RNA polymerase sigma factor (sigma-70 family)
MTVTDEELVRAIQEGDVLAYETLVKRYQHGLFVFVLRIVRDSALASDVVQNSLVKVYEVIDRIDTKKKFSTFVFEIAKNAAISELRKRKHDVSLEEIVDFAEEESFVEAIYRADLAGQVRESVASLPAKYRTVISLYYFEDLSYEEMGEKLKLPINTVRTHLKRAKEQLKKLLQPYEND